ncbi:MAG: hypothetical protein JWP75_578 [Frondihabitans sp.]|nr:hypothetical protein [Frondihabitans sp.]
MTHPIDSPPRADRRPSARRPDGPPAGILAAVSLALSLCAIVVPLLISGTGYPTPSSSADEVASYFTAHASAGTLTGFFTFAASVPIGIYAATVYARLLRRGVRVPGPGISFFGGLTASILLATSGLLTWSLGQASGGASAAVVRLLNDLVFALGGVGFVGGIGLLIAGIAVPSLILRLVPRWLTWVGLAIAVASEVSFFALLWPGFDALLPVGRFLGLLWLIAVGVVLPRSRHEVAPRAGV